MSRFGFLISNVPLRIGDGCLPSLDINRSKYGHPGVAGGSGQLIWWSNNPPRSSPEIMSVAGQDSTTSRFTQAHAGRTLMFTDKHPHAGGRNHYAAYLVNSDGYEVELVATTA
jgi:hypothetical protein